MLCRVLQFTNSAKWFHEKLPKGAFQRIIGYGGEIGSALTSHPGINQITFTVSVLTGIEVMKSTSNNVAIQVRL